MTSALQSAIEVASHIDLAQAAQRCGFGFERTTEGAIVRARLLSAEVLLAVPGFEQVGGEPLPPHVRAIIIYHLATSDGTEPVGEWISFTELPDGMFYVSAYRGYTGAELVRCFGDDVVAAREAAEMLGGTSCDLPGDVAVVFDVMPRLPLALVYWAGDEEFDARADFLFDSTASRQLATDCLAVCCSWVTHRLAAARREPEDLEGGQGTEETTS